MTSKKDEKVPVKRRRKKIEEKEHGRNQSNESSRTC